MSDTYDREGIIFLRRAVFKIAFVVSVLNMVLSCFRTDMQIDAFKGLASGCFSIGISDVL